MGCLRPPSPARYIVPVVKVWNLYGIRLRKRRTDVFNCVRSWQSGLRNVSLRLSGGLCLRTPHISGRSPWTLLGAQPTPYLSTGDFWIRSSELYVWMRRKRCASCGTTERRSLGEGKGRVGQVSVAPVIVDSIERYSARVQLRPPYRV